MSQFCRACGTDLRAVRAGLERPDDVTISASNARVEIGRALAARIRELQGAGELKTMADDLLPKLEKFLESPEEKRLRRMRLGVITAASGLGAMFTFLITALGTGQKNLIVAAATFGIAFFVGVGIVINGKLLSVPSKQARDRSDEASIQSALDQLADSEQREVQPVSIIEHTTHKLSNEPAGARRPHTSNQK